MSMDKMSMHCQMQKGMDLNMECMLKTPKLKDSFNLKRTFSTLGSMSPKIIFPPISKTISTLCSKFKNATTQSQNLKTFCSIGQTSMKMFSSVLPVQVTDLNLVLLSGKSWLTS